MVAQMPDLVVLDRKRWPVMAIEVQNHNRFNREFAMEFRREYVPQMAIAEKVEWLMITSQDTAYVWMENASQPPGAAPTYEINVKPIIEYYLTRFPRDLQDGKLHGDIVRQFLSFWIEDAIRSFAGEPRPPIPQELASLFEQLRGGRVQEEVAYR